MKPEDFAGREPKLVLEDYFAGETKAWGLFRDRFGNLKRSFVVNITGSWDGEVLTLDETFRFDDGETDRRLWRIRKTGEHGYSGTAEGVIGVAEGSAYGNVFNWTYNFEMKVGDGTWKVHFDDWLFLQDDEMLINRADVTKFGILLGEITLVFRRLSTGEAVKVEKAS